MIPGTTGGSRAGSFLSAVLPILAVAVLLAARANATNYYACDCDPGAEAGCTPGNDAAAGTSPATAWRTYDRLQDAVATSFCGDTFNFCRGGLFDAADMVEWAVASRDCSSNHSVIQSYQPGSFQNNPVVAGGNVTFNFGSSGTKGVTLRDVDVVCPTDCDNGVGAVHANVDDVVLERILVDGFNIGVQVGTELTVTLRNSIVRNNESQGMIGQAGDGTLIEENLFENNGCLTGTAGGCGLQHALYFNNLTLDNDRTIIVRGNTFSGNTLDSSNGGACNGNVFAIRGGLGVTVEDNVFMTPTTPEAMSGCNVVRMSASTTNEQVCTDCVFRRNKIIGGHTLFEFESWIGGFVENNILYSPATTTISQAKAAISHEPSGAGAPASVGATVRNNSIVVGSSGGGSLAATALLVVDGAGTTNVYSNAIRMIGSGANDVCFRFISTTGRDQVTENHTICHRSNTNAAWTNWGTGDQTLAQWQAVTLNGDNSQDTDPGFANPPDDFTLSSGDAAIDAGHPALSSPEDYAGSSRPVGSGFDVGAHELGAAPPPEFPLPPILLD